MSYIFKLNLKMLNKVYKKLFYKINLFYILITKG